jgi:predicted Fe-S protein YdhL (DUF1289 family)
MTLKVSKDVIKSPCIKVCNFDFEKEICKSCYRTLSEISRWSRMTDEEKMETIKQLGERITNELK